MSLSLLFEAVCRLFHTCFVVIVLLTVKLPLVTHLLLCPSAHCLKSRPQLLLPSAAQRRRRSSSMTTVHPNLLWSYGLSWFLVACLGARHCRWFSAYRHSSTRWSSLSASRSLATIHTSAVWDVVVNESCLLPCSSSPVRTPSASYDARPTCHSLWLRRRQVLCVMSSAVGVGRLHPLPVYTRPYACITSRRLLIEDRR